jgi:uncharacterized protein YbjT (DUF2867 family)
MKLACFGATGHIGSRVLDRAIASGHEVTVLVRSPQKLGPRAAACNVIVSGLDDAAAVKSAIVGADAVIATLAAGNGTLAAFDAAALPIMQRFGPHRIVSLVGAAVRMPHDPSALSLSVMTAMMRLIPNGLLRDASEHAVHLQASGLNWTLVRAANFSDEAASHGLRIEPEFSMRLSAKVNRETLADLILRLAVEGGYEGEAPMVCDADTPGQSYSAGRSASTI